MGKHWFAWAVAALLVVGAQAEEKGKDKPRDGGFAAMDADKDGKISRKEFVNAEKRKAKELGRGFDEKRMQNLFQRKDRDEDGFLTKEEMAGKTPKKQPKPDDGENEGNE